MYLYAVNNPASKVSNDYLLQTSFQPRHPFVYATFTKALYNDFN